VGVKVETDGNNPNQNIMAKMVKVIEVLAQSDRSWEDAAKNALDEAKKTLRNIRSIYVQELEAKVEKDKITQFRINAKISFDIESNRSSKRSR
jgi:flavin-binding protein dodecin